MSKRAEEKADEFYRGGNPYREHPEEDWKREGFIDGYEQAEEYLGWHSVEESLPPIDEEVIVLTDHLNLDCFYRIGFGHIVNEEAKVDIDGKPYKPESHNGWNIPGVRFWMPCPEIPNE